MSENKLTILTDTFRKEDTGEEITGVTIMMEGIIKSIFDKIREDNAYDSYHEVIKDIVFAGVRTVISKDQYQSFNKERH